jgi:hypothetical protein
MIRQGTGDPVEPQQQASVTVEKATYYRVDCPQRKKAPTVKDAVVWRNSPDMEDRVTEDDDDVDPDLAKGAEDGSIWRAVVETPEWVQAENVSCCSPSWLWRACFSRRPSRSSHHLCFCCLLPADCCDACCAVDARVGGYLKSSCERLNP